MFGGFKICNVLVLTAISKEVLGCSWPTSWDGAWLDSTDGTITFARATTQVTSGWEITLGSTSVTSWTCVAKDNINNYFVFRGDSTLTFFSSNLVPYLCIKWIEVTSNSFYYYVYTDYQANLNERAYLESYNPSISSWSPSTYCSPTNAPGDEEFRMAVKQGYITTAKQDFPAIIQGMFTYTYTNGGTAYCSSGSFLDLCNDVSTAAFNYTACSTVQFFSQEGVVHCVASITSGSTTYISLYNPGTVDNVNYFKFSCLAITSTASGSTMSTSAGSCERGQTPTVSTSTGGTLSLDITSNCSSDGTTQSGLTTDSVITQLNSGSPGVTSSLSNANNSSSTVDTYSNWFCATMEDAVCYAILFGVCFGGTLLFSGLLIVFCAHKSKRKEKTVSRISRLPTQLLVSEMTEPVMTPPGTTRL